MQICNYNKLEYVVSIASIIALLSSIIFPSAKADNNDNNMSKMGKGGQTIVSSPQGQAIGQPGVAVDSYPIGVAVNPITKKIYVTNEFSNTVSVIDGTT